MITSPSNFVSSSLGVGHNAVKSILFRIAGIALQISVFKLFSLLASVKSAFTAYLMFTEDYIQRFLFVLSRGFSHHAALVFFLTIFLLGAGLYDTLLWGLDSPGYVAKKQNVTAASVKNQLLKRPGYVVFSSTKPGEVAGLDKHFSQLTNANLFNSDLNYTMTGKIEMGKPESVPPTRKFNPQRGVGPRIWLDNEGFSVSPDTYVTSATSPDMDPEKYYDCPWKPGENDSAGWDCTFDNRYAGVFLKDTNIGQPEIHWDDETDLQYLSVYLKANREDNPWAILGIGGDTAMMKQMFTVTKGRRRHTFLETVMKISSVHDYYRPFARDEVHDVIKRSWSTDPSMQNDPFITQITEKIGNARAQNNSFQLGGITKIGNSVAQSNIEYLNVESVPDKVIFSLLRLSAVNITLIRSETLPEPVKPFEKCDKYFYNQATGGETYGTNCYQEGAQNKTNTRFLGQMDTSSVLIISGTLGDGSSNISSKAFNQDAFDWFTKNDQWLDNLVLSRGYILGVDPDLVTVEVSSLQPALSYLQVLLVVFPVFLAAIVWGLLWYFAASHYSSSLLANLYATTNAGGTDTSGDPEYIHKMPDIDLIRKGDKVQMATSTGVFMIGEESDYNGNSISVVNEKVEDKRGSYAPVNNPPFAYESPALLPG